MYQRQHDLEDAATDTCTWLLSHEKYTTWLAQPQALLWIAGKPGAGKSTLVGYALKQASHSSDVVASFFFFGRGIDLQKSSRGLYRSLLHQLLDHFPDMLSEFSSLYKKKCDTERKSGSNLEWHERELREFLEKWIPRASKDRPIRIYVDALDEAGREAAEELIKYFKRLTERLSPTGAELRICFSCRHYPILAPRDALQICVEDMNHQDIATHVRQSLENHFSDTDRTQLEQEIIGKASGVFLWVILVIPTVIKSRGDGDNLRKICEKINKISSKLEDLYEQILSKIEDQKRAAQLMQWVCFAMRPLSLGELRFAMVVDVTNHFASLKECENSVDFAETDEQMRRTVTSLSGGLAEIVEYQNRQTVRFIHQSVNDYLIDGGLHNLDTSFFQDINKYLRQSGLPSLENSWSDNVVGLAHFRLSRSCVKYMTLKEVMGYATAQVEISEASEIMEMEMMESEFPFLQYSQKWASHAKIVEKQRMPQKDLLILSRWPSEKIFHSWWEQSDRKWVKNTLLGVASQYSLLSVIEAMIDSGKSFDFNAKSNRGESALSVAAVYGQEAVVQLLIKQDDIDINSKDKWGQTPLSFAAERGHEVVIRLLIERDGVEIDSKDEQGQTPLSIAAENGHEAMVRLLIERDDIEIDSKDKRGQTPLSTAAYYGNEAVVRLLIERDGVEIDSKDKWEQTPLSKAAQRGHEAIIRLLIERDGVEINSKDKWGRTPLSLAAEDGHEAMVRLLIEWDGVEIDSKDKWGRTPLSLAAGNGHEAMVRLLIERDDVEIDSKNEWGQTPLSFAAERGHEVVVRLLIERDGVEIDSKDEQGQTPLSLAAERGHEVIVRLLIKRDGVEIDSKDILERTPLSLAAENGHEAMVRLLIERDGVKIDSKDILRRTPLSLAAENGHEAMVRLLIERDGVEIDSKNSLGATPLLFAAYYGQEAVARLLIQRGGAQVDWKEPLPLCEAIRDRHEAAIRLLSERGIETAWEEREIFSAHELELIKQRRH